MAPASLAIARSSATAPAYDKSRLGRPLHGLPLGIAAAMTSAAIWGSALTMTRLGVSGTTAFRPADIAMMRFFVPAVVLLPVLWRAWPRLKHVHPICLSLMMIGGGAPFVLVAGTGLQTAGAAEAGALLPGAIPLFVAALSVALGESLGQQRMFGLGMILIAIVVIAGPAVATGDAVTWHGHVLLVTSATLQAFYAIALRRSGLRPFEAAAFVSSSSILAFAPFYFLVFKPRVFDAPVTELFQHLAYQGTVPGLLTPVAFAIAVSRLGAARAAAFGGLSPAAATLFGALLLGETPDFLTSVGVAIAGLGAVLVSGADLRWWGKGCPSP